MNILATKVEIVEWTTKKTVIRILAGKIDFTISKF